MNFSGSGDRRVRYGVGSGVRGGVGLGDGGRREEVEGRREEVERERDLAWLDGFGGLAATNAPVNSTDAFVAGVGGGEAVPGRVTTGRVETEQVLDALVPGWRNDPDAFENAMGRVQSWTDPSDNVSRVLGAAVTNVGGAVRGDYESVVNPLADSGRPGALNAPTLSDALRAEGVPEGLALASEFVVPDPLGAGRAADLIPVVGAFGVGFKGFGRLAGDLPEGMLVDEYPEVGAQMPKEEFEDLLLDQIVDTNANVYPADGLSKPITGGQRTQNAVALEQALVDAGIAADEQQAGLMLSETTSGNYVNHALSDIWVDETQFDVGGEIPRGKLFQGFTGNATDDVIPVAGSSNLEDADKKPFSGEVPETFLERTVELYGKPGHRAWNYAVNGFLRNLDVVRDYNQFAFTPGSGNSSTPIISQSEYDEGRRVFEEAIDAMDKTFVDIPSSSQPITLYRSQEIPSNWVSGGEEGLNGLVLQDPGYSSASVRPVSAASFLRGNYPFKTNPVTGETTGGRYPVFMKIHVPSGAPVAPIQNLSVYPSEHEVLLPRNLRLTVKNVEKKVNDNHGGTYFIVDAEPDFSDVPYANESDLLSAGPTKSASRLLTLLDDSSTEAMTYDEALKELGQISIDELDELVAVLSGKTSSGEQLTPREEFLLQVVQDMGGGMSMDVN